ncbi:transporter [Clostridium sp. CX1]|uniref:putative ABC transporter permease subunit n=1 Tax=Clostridium sp. CX1 TaxID=2978346 RepID=UPI0021C0D377|nr:transporter [Clostridium sp. CX1]MCT8977401.1 transporter [Clostridium sp. CX1]
MSRYIALTKVLLKNGGSPLRQDKKKRNKTLAMWGLLALAFAPTILLIIQFIGSAYDVLLKINQQGLILGLGVSFVSIFIFFFGIFYSLNVLYFGNDIENLLPLPFKPSEILGAKFTVALFYEYLTELILLLPLLIVYGIKSDAGIVYYLNSAIIFLLLPIMPLAISSVLNMILMSFTNIGRHRDKLKILGGIIAMFFAIGLNIGMQRIGVSSRNPEKMLQMITAGNNSLLEASNKMFPGTAIVTKALIYNSSLQGLVNMFLFAGITLVVILLFVMLGEKLYFRGVVGISETSSKRRELSSKELAKQIVKKTSLNALTKKELRLLFRTPVYFMNCILMNFLWPVFMLIPAFTQPEMLVELRNTSEFIKDPSIISMVIGISLAASIFLASTNGITSTAISREGQNIFISKYLPTSYKTQITAKLLSGIIMGTISVIIMILAAVLLIRIPLYLPFVVLVSSLPGIIFSSLVGILIDLNFPKLTWDNEVKAVKQNFNVIINLVLGMIGGALVAFLAIRLQEYGVTVSISLCILFVIIDYILYQITVTKGAELFANIEV